MENKEASVVVLVKGEKVLLAKRSKDSKNFPNEWSFVGGKVEEGETPLDAVVRETKEELGVGLTPSGVQELPFSPMFTKDIESFKVFLFIAQLPKGVEISLSEEHEEWGLFPLYQTPHLVGLAKDVIELLRGGDGI